MVRLLGKLIDKFFAGYSMKVELKHVGKFYEQLNEVTDKDYFIRNYAIQAFKDYDIERADCFFSKFAPAFVRIYGNYLYRYGHLYLVTDNFDKLITYQDWKNKKYNKADIIKLK